MAISLRLWKRDSSSRVSHLVPLRVVEKLFVYDLAVGDFVNGYLFHLHPLVLRFKREIHLENNREMRARDQRAFDNRRVHFVICVPPFAFSEDGGHPLRLTRAAWRSTSLHADDFRRIEGFYGLEEIALRA